MKRIKTLTLMGLIVINILLASKIWFNKKLWPDGYNFFSVVSDNFIIQKISSLISGGESDYSNDIFHEVYVARQVIVKSGNDRVAFTSKDKAFSQIYPEFSNILKTIYTSPDITAAEVEKDEWLDALKSRSVYADYMVPVSSEFFGQFLLNEKSSGIQGVSSFSKVVLSLADSSTSTASVYIDDYENKTYMKFTVPYNKEGLIGTIEALKIKDADILKFAHELNLDTQKENAVEAKVLFDSMVLLPQWVEQMPVLTLGNKIDVSGEVQENILQKFNSSSYRRLVDVNDNILFVENYSTLKISNDGYLEYKAVEADKGINVSSAKGGNSQYEIISNVTRFVSDVCKSLNIGAYNIEVRISSPLTENNTNKYTFTFEYYYKGFPVLLNNNSAITVDVENGHITSYVQSLNMFNKTGENIQTVSVLEAIDIFYEKMERQDSVVNITDIYLGYNYNNGALKSSWLLKTENNKTIYSVDN